MTKTISINCAADSIEFKKLRKMYDRDTVVIPLIELAAVEASIIEALSVDNAEKNEPSQPLFSLASRADEVFKTLTVMLDCREEIVEVERNLLAELAALFMKSSIDPVSDSRPACKVCPVERNTSVCDENRCVEKLTEWARNEAVKRHSLSTGAK